MQLVQVPRSLTGVMPVYARARQPARPAAQQLQLPSQVPSQLPRRSWALISIFKRVPRVLRRVPRQVHSQIRQHVRQPPPIAVVSLTMITALALLSLHLILNRWYIKIQDMVKILDISYHYLISDVFKILENHIHNTDILSSRLQVCRKF
jgi:hypothetical protein